MAWFGAGAMGYSCWVLGLRNPTLGFWGEMQVYEPHAVGEGRESARGWPCRGRRERRRRGCPTGPQQAGSCPPRSGSHLRLRQGGRHQPRAPGHLPSPVAVGIPEFSADPHGAVSDQRRSYKTLRWLLVSHHPAGVNHTGPGQALEGQGVGETLCRAGAGVSKQLGLLVKAGELADVSIEAAAVAQSPSEVTSMGRPLRRGRQSVTRGLRDCGKREDGPEGKEEGAMGSSMGGRRLEGWRVWGHWCPGKDKCAETLS